MPISEQDRDQLLKDSLDFLERDRSRRSLHNKSLDQCEVVGELTGDFTAVGAVIFSQIVRIREALRLDPFGTAVGQVGELRLAALTTDTYVGFKPPDSIAANVIWILPATDGTAGQVLSTNGAKILSWITPAGGGVTFATPIATLIGADLAQGAAVTATRSDAQHTVRIPSVEKWGLMA